MSDQEFSEERVLEVANQVQLLLQFAAMMVEDLPMLHKVAKQSGEISSHVLTLAPVLGAVGADYEEKHMEAEVRRKRAVALVNLIQVISDTETDRTKFKQGQAAKAAARAQLSGILGL